MAISHEPAICGLFAVVVVVVAVELPLPHAIENRSANPK
jgi:hypothetical protein